MTIRVGILLFDEVEVLDAAGPFEVFAVAGRITALDADGPAFEVVTIGAHGHRPVVARHGLPFVASHTLESAPPLDLLVVPGGVTTAAEADAALIGWIAARSGTATIASVCTGAFLLAAAGILTDQAVTTHGEDQAELARRYPALTVVDGQRWVRAGHVYTSGGISAGLDLSVQLIADLVSPELAERTARQMEYTPAS